MEEEVRQQLPESAQHLLDISNELLLSTSKDDKLLSLLRYRQTFRHLQTQIRSQELSTRSAQSRSADLQRQLWAVNQQFNQLTAEIEHCRRRRYAFQQIPRFTQSTTDLPHEAMLAGLEEERRERVARRAKLEAARAQIDAVKLQIEQQRTRRREVGEALGTLVGQSSRLSALLHDAVVAAGSGVDAGMQIDDLGGKEEHAKKSLSDLFAELCNVHVPPWNVLRFFKASTTNTAAVAAEEEEDVDNNEDELREAEETERVDEYIGESLRDVDHIRFIIGDLKLSLFGGDASTASNPSSTYSLRLDPIEYQLTDEQAEAWLRGVVGEGLSASVAGIVGTVRCVADVWKREADLREEYAKLEAEDEGRLVAGGLRRPAGPHVFEFTMTGGAEKSSVSAVVSVATVPTTTITLAPNNPSSSGGADVEAFATRCRLVQDRLNSGEMSASIAVQFMFLRKLIQ